MITNASLEKDAREGFYRLTLKNWEMAGETLIVLLVPASTLGVLRAACDKELRAIQPKPPKPNKKKQCAYCGGSGKKLFNDPCGECDGKGYEPLYLSEFEE